MRLGRSVEPRRRGRDRKDARELSHLRQDLGRGRFVAEQQDRIRRTRVVVRDQREHTPRPIGLHPGSLEDDQIARLTESLECQRRPSRRWVVRRRKFEREPHAECGRNRDADHQSSIQTGDGQHQQTGDARRCQRRITQMRQQLLSGDEIDRAQRGGGNAKPKREHRGITAPLPPEDDRGGNEQPDADRGLDVDAGFVPFGQRMREHEPHRQVRGSHDRPHDVTVGRVLHPVLRTNEVQLSEKRRQPNDAKERRGRQRAAQPPAQQPSAEAQAGVGRLPQQRQPGEVVRQHRQKQHRAVRGNNADSLPRSETDPAHFHDDQQPPAGADEQHRQAIGPRLLRHLNVGKAQRQQTGGAQRRAGPAKLAQQQRHRHDRQHRQQRARQSRQELPIAREAAPNPKQHEVERRMTVAAHAAPHGRQSAVGVQV